MFNFFVFVLCVCVKVVFAMPAEYTVDVQENEVHSYGFPFVTRVEWRARSPLKRLSLLTPVPYVVIHHSYTPKACRDKEQCCEAMRTMQEMHVDGRGWWDVGYNFAVGSDGAAYEGRGWSTLGAHALHFNTVSIGICLIGDWSFELPPEQQLKTAKDLIAAGVELGYIRADYRLVGHRQVRQTECPGDALYADIKDWSHYSPFPSSVEDLINVKELSESVRGSGLLPYGTNSYYRHRRLSHTTKSYNPEVCPYMFNNEIQMFKTVEGDVARAEKGRSSNRLLCFADRHFFFWTEPLLPDS